MRNIPENFVAVGQLTVMKDGNTGIPFDSGTFGSTVGNLETIYVANIELGIKGDGSSLSTPQIAAAAGLYSIENPNKSITRHDFLEYLKVRGVVEEFERFTPYTERDPKPELWRSNRLNVDRFSDWVDAAVRRRVGKPQISTRRDFLKRVVPK